MTKTVARIQSDPNYQLWSANAAFGWTLAIIMLVLYYGYIAIVGVRPEPDRDQGRAASSPLASSWAWR